MFRIFKLEPLGLCNGMSLMPWNVGWSSYCKTFIDAFSLLWFADSQPVVNPPPMSHVCHFTNSKRFASSQFIRKLPSAWKGYKILLLNILCHWAGIILWLPVADHTGFFGRPYSHSCLGTVCCLSVSCLSLSVCLWRFVLWQFNQSGQLSNSQDGCQFLKVWRLFVYL